MTLSEYVIKRNGVPLGARGSLSRNLKNAFGAESNAAFWKFWNPVWGYYLAKYVYLPLKRLVPDSLAALLTFTASGAFHDVAIGVLGFGWQSFLSLWFFVMGLFFVASKRLNIGYGHLGFPARVFINVASLGLCFFVALIIDATIF